MTFIRRDGLGGSVRSVFEGFPPTHVDGRVPDVAGRVPDVAGRVPGWSMQ